VRLFEFEGKQLFKEEGIPIPDGDAVNSAEEAVEVAERIGYPVAVKSQVLSGSRGKRGGIKLADTREEVVGHAGVLLDQGFSNEKVGTVLVEKKVDIAREFYLSIVPDSYSGKPLLMGSPEGGVDIESVSHTVVTEPVDVFRGLQPYQVRKVIKSWGLGEEQVRKVIELALKLYGLFHKYDAELVEINPLVMTGEGDIIALDSKVIINDNALFRQPRFKKTRERFDNELEYKAATYNLNYVKLDGNIGVLCTGAGLTLATLDLIAKNGGRAANFLESGGGNYQNAYNGLNLVLSDPDVKVLLINTFGLVSRADVICEGLAKVLKDLDADIPVVASIRGTGEEKARKIFKDELGIEPFDNTESAVLEAIRLAG